MRQIRLLDRLIAKIKPYGRDPNSQSIKLRSGAGRYQ